MMEGIGAGRGRSHPEGVGLVVGVPPWGFGGRGGYLHYGL